LPREIVRSGGVLAHLNHLHHLGQLSSEKGARDETGMVVMRLQITARIAIPIPYHAGEEINEPALLEKLEGRKI
jgi:hypothetical protein